MILGKKKDKLKIFNKQDILLMVADYILKYMQKTLRY